MVFSIFQRLQEKISSWFLSFLQVKNISLNSQTACIFSAFFQGTSSALNVAEADKVEQCPSAVPGSVCQTDPKTMQLHIEEAAVTSARAKGKMSGMIRKSHAELVQVQNAGAQYCQTFYFSLLNEIKCCTLQLLHQFTESLMVSIIIVIRMP